MSENRGLCDPGDGLSAEALEPPRVSSPEEALDTYVLNVQNTLGSQGSSVAIMENL